MEDSGPAPDAISYNAALLALASARSWQESLVLLGNRSQRGLVLDRQALSSTLRVMSTSGVPLHSAARAVLHFEVGKGGISRLDLEDAARLLEGSTADGGGNTVAGAAVRAEELIPSAAFDPKLEADARALTDDIDAEVGSFRSLVPGVLQDLDLIVKAHYPSVQLELYGSLVDGTAVSSGDLDVSAQIAKEELQRAHPDGVRHQVLRSMVLRAIRNTARTSGAWEVRGAFLVSRVPTLALLHLPSGYNVDLAVNNSTCVEKNQLLRDLATDHVKHLAAIVKLWARRRQVYGKAVGRLSGFALTQLAIFSSQVVPIFAKQASLSQLLRNFFAFYAWHMRWEQECVSVVVGRRSMKVAGRGVPHLSIEDCVSRELDICASDLLEDENARLRVELERAASLLNSPEPSLATVLEELPPLPSSSESADKTSKVWRGERGSMRSAKLASEP
eukprot:TRINITY_DN24010_c0_g1_i1.p1 TRINITY_DN24010_c0_g1~~TRINITY_DN24010_c0_g1_i1.p1  ORF type:complete len:489 (-),score=86.19 TRINITY_DN24010_c0_g1_i1:34-1374(-)